MHQKYAIVELQHRSEAKNHKEAVTMGYGSPPWIFKGHAIYQLSLVKLEEVMIQFCVSLTMCHFIRGNPVVAPICRKKPSAAITGQEIRPS